jgi:type I restriction enzyme M protein
MLDSTVKQQINNARDILVGKIPDPKGQIDQITNALIYKFMDDQDRLALTLPGGKETFFVNELKPYAWHKLFDSKLSNQEKADLYIEGIHKLSKAKHLPELFRDIFKDAFLPFRAPDTIAMFLGEINKFDYKHSENLGNAFEYLLSFLSVQGDLGSFRTPRNIIEFIVDAVDPQKEDTILDPACGTAGFLIEAYKHITQDNKLSPNEIQGLAKNIHGIEIDPGMAKIARVNLYLHGFKTPHITEDDTLSNENLWGKKYDVILANPPFMSPKGGIVPHDKFGVNSKRAEVLFTDYIAEHLKLGGRAGVVVPEGVIFQSGTAYKQLRKMLIENNYLWAVVSLPAGVFNPYIGVKTSILLFDRARAEKNKEIMFFQLNNY